MLHRLQKLARVLTITFGAATVAMIGTSVVHSPPAEAGVLSTIKNAAKSTVKYTAGGVAHWAKATAGGAKLAANTTVVPFAKGIGSAAKDVGKAAYSVGKAAYPYGKKLAENLWKPGKHLLRSR